MGSQCVKTNPSRTDIMDMRDEKSRREYYLNMNQNGGPQNGGEPSALGQENYDIREQRLVGYGHIQKVNMFHHIPKRKSLFMFQYIWICLLEPDYKIEH